MHTCIVCPRSTKGLVRVITHQIKGMSLRPSRRRKKLQREAEEAAGKSGERLEEEEEEAGGEEESEWVAEPEPGVFITLVPLPEVGNRVKKIRFSEERFDDWGAQKWWSENYDKVMELYCIASPQSSPTLAPSDDESKLVHKEEAEGGGGGGGGEGEGGGKEAASRSSKSTTGSSKASPEPQAHSEITVEVGSKVLEWIVEDEPGVFVTVRSMPDGSREILRVELSRERFGEVKARVWWEENKARLQRQYSLNL